MKLSRTPRWFFPFTLLIAASIFIGGCGKSKTSDRSISFLGPAEAADIVLDRKKLLGGTSSGVYVDPRSVREFEESRIPGAMHVPFETVRDDHRELDAFDSIVVYGDDYNSPVAIAMSKTLIELGYKKVYTLRGGLRAWRGAGRVLEGTKEN